jgi:nicotinate phosphoribosyltransferase
MPQLTGLVGEFYQLVLAATYHADGLWGDATFDLYARALPEDWGYLVACGLEPVMQTLEAFRFSPEEIALLQRQSVFARVPPTFFEALQELRFSGELHAVPEGAPIFPNQPILRLTAPLMLCTLVETRLLQLIGASTAVASRASRIASAASGRPVWDFGSRRASGGEASLLAARAAFIGGAAGTTNAQAALTLGIPSFGTMSDTFLAAYGDDALAYAAFRLHFPGLGHYALPDDDPGDGVARFQSFRDRVSIVRIDHDDLARTAWTVREALGRHGMSKVKILGSGHLDEHRVEKLVASGAPIDMFACGRALATSGEPGMRLAFRIAEMQRGSGPQPVTRSGSSPWPGRKQVIRRADHDLVCLEAEAPSHLRNGWPLLRPVMRFGARLDAAEALATARERRAAMVSALPATITALRRPAAREVRVSDALARLALSG